MNNIILYEEKLQTKLRWFLDRDCKRAEEIDSNNLQWSINDFKEIRKRTDIGTICSEIDGHVIGFGIFELHNDKIMIVNMAVDTILRRRSIGTQMINRLKLGFLKKDRHIITTVVDENNLEAQLFLRQQDFIATKTMPRFFENYHDGYLMEFYK